MHRHARSAHRGLRSLPRLAAVPLLVALGAAVVDAAPASADNGKAVLVIGVAPSTVVWGQPFNANAVIQDVSGSCTNVLDCNFPHGTVQFFADGGYLNASTDLAIATVVEDNATIGGSRAGVQITTALEVGPHTIQANYAGDFEPTSAATQLLVVRAGCALALTQSSDVSTSYEVVTFTADLGSAGYDGEVLFSSPDLAVVYGRVPVVDGRATLSRNFLYAAASNTIVAHYSGDAHHEGCASRSVTHNIVPPTTGSGTVSGAAANSDVISVDSSQPDTPLHVLDNDDLGTRLLATFEITSPPSHGTATVSPIDGLISYVPEPGYVGNDQLRYRIFNGIESFPGRDEATVRLLVTCTAEGLADAYTTASDTVLHVEAPGVLANDTCQGDSFVQTKPAHGVVRMDRAGGFTYTPTAGYTGPDSFTYVDADVHPVTVSVEVTAPPTTTSSTTTSTTTTTTTTQTSTPTSLGTDTSPATTAPITAADTSAPSSAPVTTAREASPPLPGDPTTSGPTPTLPPLPASSPNDLGGGVLPATGRSDATMLWLGFACSAAGASLLLVRRRGRA